MKTLKKTLCLVLVLAMAMSLCVFSTGAYTDSDAIEYKEAVDVLSAIGVIDGMDDGSFDADGTLTRAQACKIITYMLGAEDYAIATGDDFTDVPADHWAAGYIAFCAAAGIVNGYGDGKFGPEDTLTGYAWAKILLVALGYNAEAAGMIGSDWQINVAKLAASNDLFDGVEDKNNTKDVTREEACQYAFNALAAKTVSYVGGTTYTIAGITVTSGGVMTTGTKTFAEVNFPLLKKSAKTEDAYGAPAHGWYYGKTETTKTFVGLYVDEATLVYTAATALKTVTADLKGYTFVGAPDAYDTVAEIQIATGNGVKVSVYADSDNNVYDVTVDPAFDVVKCSSVKNVAESKTKGAYTLYTFDDASTATVFTSVVDEDADVDVNVINGTIEKGDYVLKTTVGSDIYFYEAETITGTVTKVTSKGVYTIGGEDYELSKYFEDAEGDKVGETNYSAPVVSTKVSVTFVLDQYGYVVKQCAAVADDDVYGLVIAKDYNVAQENGKWVTTYSATVVALDGTVSEVYSKTEYDTALIGKVCTVVTNSKGYTTLAVADATAYKEISTITAKSQTLDTGLYASSKTLYVFVNYVYDEDLEAYVVDGTVSTVTGYANVESFKATATKFYAFDTDTTADGVADVVLVYDNVKAVTTDTYVFALGGYTYDGTTYTCEAIVKGETTTVEVTTTEAVKAPMAEYVMYNVESGAATVATTYATAAAVSNYAGMLKIGDKSDAVKDSWTCAEDVPVYVIDTYDYTCAEYDFGDLEDAITAGDVYVALKGTTVLAVYVVAAVN